MSSLSMKSLSSVWCVCAFVLFNAVDSSPGLIAAFSLNGDLKVVENRLHGDIMLL